MDPITAQKGSSRVLTAIFITLFIIALVAIPLLLANTGSKEQGQIQQTMTTTALSPTPAVLTPNNADTTLNQTDTTLQTTLNQVDTDLQTASQVDASQDQTVGL